MKKKKQSYYDCVATVKHDKLKIGGQIAASILADSSNHAKEIFKNMVKKQHFLIASINIGNPILPNMPSPKDAVYLSSYTSWAKEFMKRGFAAFTNGGVR